MPVDFIPLNRLISGAHNVRRTDRKAEIEALAASIAAHGLLQNLSVVRAPDDRFEVVAGARRHAALKLLAKAGTIARDHGVACVVVEDRDAGEISLAENVQRVAMDVMDEVDAFAALAVDGAGVDDIARRFGATLRHVQQRLALARLAPKIKAAYRKGLVSLDAARAFCVCDDPARQTAVFTQLPKPIVHPSSVRAHLTQGRVPASDRLAALVGVATYEAAGGRIVRDLFEPNLAFLEDGDLLRRLASEKAEAWRLERLSEGWGWVEIHLGHARLEGLAGERLHAVRRPFDADETARLAQIDDDIAILEGALDADEGDETVDVARADELDRLHDAREALVEGALVFDPALMAHAGVAISIDHDGRPVFTRGLIKRADLKTIAKLRDRSLRNAAGESAPDGADPDGPRATPGDDAGEGRDGVSIEGALPKALVERLTRARSLALRAEVAAHPHVALALLVHALAARGARGGATPGVDIVARAHAFEDAGPFTAACEAVAAESAGTWTLSGLLSRAPEDLLAALAVLVAQTVNLSHQGAGPGDRARQDVADALAGAVDLDMRAWWTPDLDFWMRCPKAFIASAIADAPTGAALSPGERTAQRAALSRMTKAELARAAVAALHDVPWVPELLATPPGRGALALTDAGVARVADEIAADGDSDAA